MKSLLFLGKREDGKDNCDGDVAIVIDHVTLATTDLGLGICWFWEFDAKCCHEKLQLPDNLEVVVLIPIGYPVDANIPEKKRKSIDEIVSWEGYKG